MKRWVRWGVAGLIFIAFILGFLIAPDRLCKLSPLGDEGEGECLGMAARSGLARCRVLVALFEEIEGSNNDVVIAGGLEGFVDASACDDLALLWTRLPVDTPLHVPPLVSSAIAACWNRQHYSLLIARESTVTLDGRAVLEQAQESGCR